MLARIWENWSPHALLVRMWHGVAPVENSLVFPQKVKPRILTRSRNSTSGYITKRNEGNIVNRYFCTHTPSSVFHNSQYVTCRTTPWPSMHRYTTFHIYMQWNTIQSLNSQENVDICYHMEESWRHYVTRNKPVTKGQVSFKFTYLRYLDVRFIEIENRRVVVRG